MTIDKFNIRVYGIFINEKKEILVADEKMNGMEFTKFPGGGLEFCEGTIDCLKRECMEEFGQEIEVLEHFYTTDFFQISAFNKNHQIVSIYYLGQINSSQLIYGKEGDGLFFRWIALEKFSENDLTFPIDKKVAGMIKEKFCR